MRNRWDPLEFFFNSTIDAKFPMGGFRRQNPFALEAMDRKNRTRMCARNLCLVLVYLGGIPHPLTVK